MRCKTQLQASFLPSVARFAPETNLCKSQCSTHWDFLQCQIIFGDGEWYVRPIFSNLGSPSKSLFTSIAFRLSKSCFQFPNLLLHATRICSAVFIQTKV